MATKNQQPMVDGEKARLNAMSNMNQQQRMELIEEITNEKASALLAQSLSNPAFNGMNTLSFAISEIAAAIRYHADAIRSTSPAQQESKFDQQYNLARQNLQITPMEQNLLTVDLLSDVAIKDAWDLWAGWKSNRIADKIEPEHEPQPEVVVKKTKVVKQKKEDLKPKQEVLKPKRKYTRKKAVVPVVIPEPIIEPVIEPPVNKWGKWNPKNFFARIDEYINAGGNILKPMEFKRFENGGYQWAIIHLYEKEKDVPTPKGAAWRAVLDAYMKKK